MTAQNQRNIAIAAAVFAAVLLAVWWLAEGSGDVSSWQGYIDADYVRVGPTLQGRVIDLAVARGQLVDRGALLFQQDPVDDQGARDEIAARLKESEARLANLSAPSRATEIAQAESDLADLRAERDRANRDCERSKSLVGSGAVSHQRYDQDCANAESTSARVASAEAKLTQSKLPTGRAPEIIAAEAVVDESRAQLVQADWRLSQRRVTAPVAARVADVYARPGETIAAGSPIVSLLPPENILVRFFVPERALPGISVGARLAVRCDSCPSGMAATVSFISPQPEYTPPVIYSESTRDKQVFLIEAHPDRDFGQILKPGQPVTVGLFQAKP